MNSETKHTINKLSARLRAVLLGGALVLAGGSIAFSMLTRANGQPSEVKQVPVRLNVDDAPIKRDSHFTTSFAPMVKQVAPSVIKVISSTKPRQISPRVLPQDDFFRRFFGWDFDGSGGPNMRTPRQHGLGSGVIVTKDGYILTNNHVIDNADDVKVALNDGRELIAKVVGQDPKTDIAVLKVDAEGLPYVTLGDSDKVEVGDLVMAVGNPFNVGLTVTMGIVSAKGRTLPNVGENVQYEDFIQTDAAINPGNSGGALVDAEGRLVGINTAILSGTGGNLGIGFAVPSNLARFAMESIIKDGRVVRSYIGVIPQDVNPALAKQFHLPNASGALVAEVMPKEPADRAGMQSGDVIVEFNGKPVEDARTLRLQVARVKPGTRVATKIIRDGHEKTLQVTLKELTDNDLSEKSRPKGDRFDDSLDGVTVGDLDRAARNQYGVRSPEVRGAIVVRIDPDSPSYEAGLREGDVIQEINHKPVRDADEAIKLSEAVKKDAVLLKLWRLRGNQGGSYYVVIEQKKG